MLTSGGALHTYINTLRALFMSLTSCTFL